MVKKYIKPINQFARILLIAGFSISALVANSQDFPGYSSAEIEKLHTAKSTAYLSVEEAQVVLLMNIARKDGARFWEQIAAPYIKEYEIAPSRYTRSLEKDLKTIKDLPLLEPDQTLFETAREHAIASGKSGALGHKSPAGTFEERLTPLRREFNYLLENCDYGSFAAVDIVMNLMIDEGIPDVGHRKNILHDKINAVGVSIEPHKTYHHNCVQVFGLVRAE